MIIQADFSPGFRAHIAGLIKTYGVERIREDMVEVGYHPAFVRAITRSIMRREGW